MFWSTEYRVWRKCVSLGAARALHTSYQACEVRIISEERLVLMCRHPPPHSVYAGFVEADCSIFLCVIYPVLV